MQTTTERPARGAGATRRRSANVVHNLDSVEGGHTVPTLPEGTQIVRDHRKGLRNSAQALKGMYDAHTPGGGAKDTWIASIICAQPDGRQPADLLWLRQVAADTIERLIAFLDDTDGFTMHEREADPADDEPSLGWARAGALGGHSDLEIGEVTL